MAQGYFDTVEANIAGNGDLWESQVQGYLKIKDYFDSGRTEPAIVVLPTGTGKTGLMAIAPYGIAKKRVLIVTPGLVIKRGVLATLNSSAMDNFWLSKKVIPSMRQLPTVVEYDVGYPKDILAAADFVIVNVQQTQAVRINSLIRNVPPDFFDVLVFDEAHHSPAQTWVDLETYFAGAKVIKVTGTPFRSNKNEKIYGEIVYEYTLARAMVKGYVKRLIKETWIGEELTFQITEDGVTKTVPYSVVKELKDADWTSRQVAYSPSCSLNVVRESLRLLREKRDATGQPHKIIAVACGIEHAEDICRMYQEEGANAVVVASAYTDDQNAAALNDFENDRFQVVVNVGMLGEGFDHPLISIGAIFRPYRTLLPYAQFAGRTLRAIKGGTEVDNTAHLVHHQALNLDDLWAYYKKEQDRATILERFQKIAEELAGEAAEPREMAPDEDVQVNESGELSSLVESYLVDIDIARSYREALQRSQQQKEKAEEALRSAGLPVSPEVLQAIQASGENEYFRSKRPDLDFKERKKGLFQAVQDGVAAILTDLGIDPKQPPDMFRGPKWRGLDWIHRQGIDKLDGFLVTMVNDQLRVYIGRKRSEWTTADFIRAEAKLPELMDGVRALLSGGV